MASVISTSNLGLYGNSLDLSAGTTANQLALLQHQHAQAASRQISRRYQAIVTGTNNDRIEGLGHFLLQFSNNHWQFIQNPRSHLLCNIASAGEIASRPNRPIQYKQMD